MKLSSLTTSKQTMRDQIVDFIHQNSRFAVTSHARPDGDSLGSSLALGLALRQLGKEVEIVQADPPPHAYRQLPGIDSVHFSEQLASRPDGVFILECNSRERTHVRNLEEHFNINIDHHVQGKQYADLNWIEPDRAAVGELIFELLGALDLTVDAAIASNIYVAILTDTGSFQFSNTNQRTFAITSELVAAGADPGTLAQQVYLSQPLSKVRLLSLVLETLQIDSSGQIAWVYMTEEMLQKTGACRSETEGIVTHPLSIDGVRVVAFLREEPSGQFRVSLRSKGSADVGRVAQHFGGGGHRNAAGLSIDGPLKEASRRVLSELESLLD